MWIVHRRTVVGLCAVVLCGVMAPTGMVSTALAAEVQVPTGAQALMTQYPGVQAHMEGSRVLALYGKPMTAGATPAEAAQWWLEDHASAFGVGALDVQLLYTHEVNFGRFTVFAYEQQMDGLPVEQGRIKLLVLNGSPDQVVYAGARLAAAPEGGFRADLVDAAAALAGVQKLERYAGLTEWSVPAKVIYYGEGDGELVTPIRAWKFTGHKTDRANPEAYTFFVDASTGELVYARDEVYYVDVDGHVSGMGSPGTLPDMASNPEAEMDLADLRVRISGGSTSYTDPNGNYVIPNSGGGSVTVIADIRGRWANVNNTAGADLQLSQSVTPPGPADFLFNTSLDEFTTSQVNGYIHTTSTHNFFKDRQPGFTDLDMALPCYVNIFDTCNAYFTAPPPSINFYAAGGGCRNSAYSSVIAHEYGHYIVYELGLSQGAFGEGYGDSIAILQYDDGVVGRNFTIGGNPIRDIANSNVDYPCSGEVHYCGQLLAGVWWEINMNLQASLGAGPGLEVARQLFVDWSVITNGGSGDNSAHPGTVLELLTLDDDDGDLSNGTPHYLEICDAFASHTIDCPEVVLIDWEYPDGFPQYVDPVQGGTVRVNVSGLMGGPAPGTGTVTYKIGTGSFTTVPMNELVPNEYEAPLPAAPCREEIAYFFSVEHASGRIVDDPPNAPFTTFSTVSATGFATIVAFDFETAPGWTVSGTASAGQWDRGVPVGGGDRGDPPTDYDGSGQCWLTGNADGDSDVEAGLTILTSPTFDLSAAEDPRLTYARWFSNDTGANPYSHVFTVSLSSDNGASWVTADYVGPGGLEVSGGWFVKTWRILDFVPLTSQFKVRFQAFDSVSQPAIIEAAVDAFEIYEIECAASLPGDFDGDGDVDLDDFGSFSACYNGSSRPPAGTCPPGVDADLDDDGDVDLDDFAIFAANYTGSL